jgi:hypothetical protein
MFTSTLTSICKRVTINSMKRTQIQLPDPLYAEVKRVAKLLDWSITEVLRRGAEYMIQCYPPDKHATTGWELPEALDLGPFLAPVEQWRDLANDPGDGQP